MSAKTLALDNEEELINEIILHNSDKAINKFVRTYQSFVIHTALRYIENYDDAEDIAQEVFIKVLDNLEKFQRKSSIKTWLYKITLNLCKNELRKRKLVSFLSLSKSKYDDDDDDDSNLDIVSNIPEPDAIIEFKEVERNFINSYSKLPEKQRETFILRFFEDMSYDEISKLLGTSVGGLKANYFQAIKKISEELKPLL